MLADLLVEHFGAAVFFPVLFHSNDAEPAISRTRTFFQVVSFVVASYVWPVPRAHGSLLAFVAVQDVCFLKVC